MASRGSFLSKAYSAARRAGLSDPAARVAAAQAALESNYGKSAPGNNFFGIKAGKTWKGGTQKLKTWEVIDGKKVTIKDSFRKYEDFEESFKDWAKLVGRRWSGVLTAQTFEEAVAALKAGLPGGYATDPNYASKLAAMNARMGDQLGATLPDEMESPSSMSRQAALDSQLSPQQQALANAHIAMGASRALNAQPLSMSPPNPGSIRGLNVPSALSRPSAPPSNFAVPDRPSPIGSAPVGQVSRAPLGPALARPSPPSNFAKGTMPSAISRPSAPPSNFAKGTVAAPTRQAAGTPTAGYNTKAQPAGTPTAGYNVSMPSGISRPATPSQAAIAGALSQAQGKIAADANAYADFESARAQGLSSLPAPAPTVNHPPNPTVGIPAAIPTTAAPALAPPTVIAPLPAVYQPRPAHQVAPVAMRPAPAATAYDVYSGMADTALDNTGQNTVSSIPGGTTVTNKYGATTGMVNGYQTAVGSMPSVPGMSMPSKSTVGGAVKGGLVGAGVAGPIGGVIGALAGAMAAKAMAEKNGTAAAASGQSGGGLLGGLFGGGTSGASSSKSSGSSKSGSSTSRSGGGGYQTSAGAQSNSKSMRY